jgi:ribosome biogenesis GTPase A
MNTLNVIIFGGERQLIEKIFPNEEKKNEEKREIRYNIQKKSFLNIFKHNGLSFKWRAIIYPELNNENYKEIRKELKDYFDKEEKEIKKNVIIFFGDNKITKIISLINGLEQTKRPLILFISNNKGDYSQFSDIRLVTYLKQDNDSEKIYNKILSYLWEKDCYFNERGNKTCKLSTANLFYKKPKGFTFLKILLIGLKRAGKSTLINLISKKLTSFELPNDQSVTKKITEYEIYPFEDEEKNNITSIKLWDTPGIEKTYFF